MNKQYIQPNIVTTEIVLSAAVLSVSGGSGSEGGGNVSETGGDQHGARAPQRFGLPPF